MDDFLNDTELSEGNHMSPLSDIKDILGTSLQVVLQNTSAGILVTDQDDRLTWVNDKILENPNTGSSMKPVAKFLMNKPAIEVLSYFKEFFVFPDVFSARIKDYLAKRVNRQSEQFSLRTGTDIHLDYIPINKDGEYLGALWGIYSIKSKTDEDTKSNGINTGFAQTLRYLGISWCEVNQKGIIQYACPLFSRSIGYTMDELVGINFLDLCDTGKVKVSNLIRSKYSLVSNKTMYFELEIKAKDKGKWFQCIVNNYLQRFATNNGFVLFMTEISEQKNIQSELEKAKVIAEKAQLAQQQFFANMSHDIRTPLNTIIGVLHLLSETKLNTQQSDFIEMILEESNFLMRLLSNVLDFSRIESGRQEVHPAEFNLRSVLDSLLKTFAFKIKERNISLNLDIDPGIINLIVGDSNLLSQVLTNLFSNAIKFTKRGEITFSVKRVRESGRNVWIEFTLKDSGIGIPKEKLDVIFKDFIQGNKKIRRDYGGFGLGLFIVKRLVDLLGGDVHVESEKGVGSKFTFTLPFLKTDKPALLPVKKKINPENLKASNAQILVVEDNPMNLKYIGFILSRLNLQFDVAEDGYLGLEKGKSKYYDLILMDVRLPDINGYELTRKLRVDGELNAATPIILVTAEALQETMEKAKDVGANEVFLKPYTPNNLLALLDKYLVDEDFNEYESDKEEFQFNERLDRNYLRQLYSGNYDYALYLFDLFSISLGEDWKEIIRNIESENWEQLTDVVHKIKPNFSMVGLTEVTKTIQMAYNKLNNGDYQSAVSLLNKVDEKLPEYIEIIDKERQRLKAYAIA